MTVLTGLLILAAVHRLCPASAVAARAPIGGDAPARLIGRPRRCVRTEYPRGSE
jgi:hypothetical protein